MEMERTILARESSCVETDFGKAEVKVCTLPDGEKRCYPEYESVSKIAEKHNISYQEVYEMVKKAFEIQRG